jgi:hypothetical protein
MRGFGFSTAVEAIESDACIFGELRRGQRVQGEREKLRKGVYPDRCLDIWVWEVLTGFQVGITSTAYACAERTGQFVMP